MYGAGKSTLYRTLSDDILNMPRVNTDEIVKSLGDWRDIAVVMQAGKIAAKKLNDYLVQGISFNQETTLCGKSILRNINKAKGLGYKVVLHYVGVESADVAKARVHSRVEHGGHGIPDTDIERRYTESISNLSTVIPMCDEATVYDNTASFNAFVKYYSGRLGWTTNQIPSWYTAAQYLEVNGYRFDIAELKKKVPEMYHNKLEEFIADNIDVWRQYGRRSRKRYAPSFWFHRAKRYVGEAQFLFMELKCLSHLVLFAEYEAMCRYDTSYILISYQSVSTQMRRFTKEQSTYRII